ncbi:Rab-GAP TBC domain-containing protein [Entamoeba marina]
MSTDIIQLQTKHRGRLFSFQYRKLESILIQPIIDIQKLKSTIGKKGIPPVLQSQQKQQVCSSHYHQFLNDFYYNFDFNKTEILALLQKDTTRLLPTVPFYNKEENIEAVQRILFVSCVFDKSLQYVQGMHEICAVLYLVFSEGEKNPELAEAEAYFGLNSLLTKIRDWYDKSCDNKPTGLNSSFKCVDQLLKCYDKELWSWLNENEVDCTCYCFRWITVLFISEYSINDVQSIWDVLFCGFESSELIRTVHCICVAMIVKNKDKLINKDVNTCLKVLMNSQFKWEDIYEIVSKVKEWMTLNDH